MGGRSEGAPICDSRRPDSCVACREALCASGPIVVVDGKTLTKIREKQNREVLALEMEAYGVYCAARKASQPRPITFIIKSVCDVADPRKNYAEICVLHERNDHVRIFAMPRNRSYQDTAMISRRSELHDIRSTSSSR
jgi:hypothetical protein